MNKTLGQARAFVDQVRDVDWPPGVQPFVLPAHTALAAVRERLPAESPILLGAQNAHWAPDGAFTGEVSMRMVADAGARLVEMGHSERRADFGETDETVARKVRAALDTSLIPLVCVGEPQDVRDRAEQVSFVAEQVRAALARIEAAEVGQVIVAYEPVWAIGAHGRPARVDEVSPVMDAIRATCRRAGDGHDARAVLYGGGVDADNATGLLADPGVDGLFVGRAGWDAAGFLQLVDLVARADRSN